MQPEAPPRVLARPVCLASPERGLGCAQCAHWAEGSGVATAHCRGHWPESFMRLVPLGTIRIPRLRRGRRPRRPASFVLGSKNTDRHTSVATLVRDDRPSVCALRACKPAGEGLASPTACSSPSGGGCRLRQVRERVSRPPVGAIHESPADMRRCPTNGLSRAPAPTMRTDVSP